MLPALLKSELMGLALNGECNAAALQKRGDLSGLNQSAPARFSG
jgi:hypothetical protein